MSQQTALQVLPPDDTPAERILICLETALLSGSGSVTVGSIAIRTGLNVCRVKSELSNLVSFGAVVVNCDGSYILSLPYRMIVFLEQADGR